MENAMLIYKKMALILKDIEPIKKEKTNSQGAGFKYRGIDDVLNALHDSFAKNEVFITTEVISRTETERQSKSGGVLFYVTSRIKFNFFTIDGSSVFSIVDGTAMDSGDKADNKCLSIALKYALLQAFLIPTEEMKDPDAESHEIKPNTQKQQTNQRAPETNEPEKPWLNPNTPQWKEAVRYVKTGGMIAAIEKKYRISKENQQKIIDESIQGVE
jgi:hypothetical protein